MRPSALRARSLLYQKIRDFFAARDVTEVSVPTLGLTTTPDPAISSIGWADEAGKQWYLQSSPEHFMKRLLAGGSGDIYYLGPAFRHGEQGRLHNVEFTLLEWYRCDFDEHQLMREVAVLLDDCLGAAPHQTLAYRDLLQQFWDEDVLGLTPKALMQFAFGHLGATLQPEAALDALYAEALRQYDAHRLFVTDFPPEQAAMAQLRRAAASSQVSAARFECIQAGVELANGYLELQDEAEQRARWQKESKRRERLGLPAIAADERLLAALASGLPDCAGVAVGVDRLLMLSLGAQSLTEVLTFSTQHL